MRFLKVLGSVLFFLTGCTGVPEGVQVIDGFEVDRYLGQWFEMARLDHSFERGLDNVTANYSRNSDGSIKVINRGYDSQKKEWKEAEGKAKFVGEPTVGKLKVSFFGPFYGSYNIIELDKEGYTYTLVCSNNRSYLWILARDKNLEKDIIERLVNKAQSLGFETDKLIYVKHDK
jgi:apolipoprotein D and lipocalin family protein